MSLIYKATSHGQDTACKVSPTILHDVIKLRLCNAAMLFNLQKDFSTVLENSHKASKIKFVNNVLSENVPQQPFREHNVFKS